MSIDFNEDEFALNFYYLINSLLYNYVSVIMEVKNIWIYIIFCFGFIKKQYCEINWQKSQKKEPLDGLGVESSNIYISLRVI